MITALQILRRLEDVVGMSGGPRPLRDQVAAELCTFFGLGPLAAAEYAETIEMPLRRRIAEVRDQRESRGALPILVLSAASERIVLGSCYPQTGDANPVIEAKKRRASISAIVESIRLLSFNEFEVFGSKLLEELGASLVKVTPHSEDQGIDFYGVFKLGDLVGDPFGLCQLAHSLTLRIAGQAKHYPNASIGPSIVRELVGSVALARHGAFSRETKVFDEFGVLGFNPVLLMLLTTGRLTRGAERLAERAGIIARSGEQLAVFLADRGIGFAGKEEVGSFDKDCFRKWLGLTA